LKQCQIISLNDFTINDCYYFFKQKNKTNMKKISSFLFAAVVLAFTSNAQLVVFGDAYAPDVTFEAFGGSTNALSIDNTVKYSGTSSLKVPVTTGYTGGSLVAAAPKNLSGYNALTFWAKNDMPYALNGVGIGNSAAPATTIYPCERNGVSITSTWTKYYIPIPVPSKFTGEIGLFHFAEGAEAVNYNIWFDDIQYENVAGGIIGTPTAAFATETLTKMVGDAFSPNGTTSTYPVNGVDQSMQTSKAFFTWNSTNGSVASVNAMGVGTASAAGSATITAMLGSVAATGSITVNVTGASSGPATAAPTPTRTANGVISLFSNAYTNRAVNTWSAGWDVADVADVQVGSPLNDTKKYTNLQYAGIEFVGANSINANDMDNIHIDIWTPDATVFRIKLVDFGPDNAYAGGDDKEHEITFNAPAQNTWIPYNIPLSSFTGLTTRANLSQILLLGSNSTLYVDNVYLFNEVLPINLSGFSVIKKNNTADLQWSTSLEQNNKGFAIERSLDGVKWNQINFINGTNARTGATYSATDLTPAAGLNYYRLKQVDFDGHSVYSTVQSLNFAGIKPIKFALFPNPTVNSVAITLGTIESNTAQYAILSADGKVVKSGIFGKSQANTVQTLDVSKLPAGLYIIKLTDGLTQQTAKLKID
jgi:Secretion system C-terminal sorting domain/Bacterial Ig-like domain (group 2)